MGHANPGKVGLVLGSMLGGFHLVWSVLVLLNWGQPVIDFVFWAHMIHVSYIVGPFDIIASATLIVLTFCVGYVMGQIGARVWNKVHHT